MPCTMPDRSSIVKNYFGISTEKKRYAVPRPKLLRLPERKKMSIAIGLHGKDGLIIAADTQETISGYTKEYRGKVPISVFKNLTVVFSGVGTCDYIDSAIEKASEKIGDYKTFNEVKGYLEERLVGYFDGYLANWASFPQNERPVVEMLIGVAMKDGFCGLFHFSGTSFQQVNRKAIGTGTILANNLLSEYCWDIQGLSELTGLAVYVVKKVKDHVDTCGGNTHLVALRDGGDFAMADSKEVERLEKKILESERKAVERLRIRIASQVLPVQWVTRAGRIESGWGV